MGISQIILYAMMLFMLLGAADRIIGNRFGLGKQFEEGFYAMGPLALGMIGLNCLAPLLGDVLEWAVGPLFRLLGADIVMVGPIVLSIDTGAYALAHEMTNQADLANYAAIIMGSMLGPTLTFAIPVAIGLIKKEDIRYLALGTLSGIVAIPFACIAGGLLAGYSSVMLLRNTLPAFLIAVLVALGLGFAPNAMVVGFRVFSKLMIGVVTAALASAILSELTGITVIKGMAPLSESYVIIGNIAVMLAGAYPLIYTITKLAKRPLAALGRCIKVDESAIAGMLAATANSIPAYAMIRHMDARGKVTNFAFICCAAFAMGDHLAFCAGVEPGLIFPMVGAKLFGGIFGVLIALLVCRVLGDELA